MNSSYVKTCLTLIVVLLAAIVLRQFLLPGTVEAQSSLSGVQITAEHDRGIFLLFDSKSGKLWSYDLFRGTVSYSGRIAEPGKPLVK